MTTPWIARALEVPPGTDLVLIPGLCEGDPQEIAGRVGVRGERAEGSARDTAVFRYGSRGARYGAWDIEILAEINNAPRLTREAIRRQAMLPCGWCRHHRHWLHTGPGVSALADVVHELTSAGMRVSIDTFDPRRSRQRWPPAPSWC